MSSSNQICRLSLRIYQAVHGGSNYLQSYENEKHFLPALDGVVAPFFVIFVRPVMFSGRSHATGYVCIFDVHLSPKQNICGHILVS